jgi:hypothetical protein
VPPRNLFPKPRPSDLVTVPACVLCNNSASMDDEYFRLAITVDIDRARFPREFAHSINSIERLARPRKDRFSRAILPAIGSAPVHTEAGVYLGHATTLNVDGERVLRVVTRIAAGLFFHHLGTRLPSNHRRSSYYLPHPTSPSALLSLAPLRSHPLHTIANGVLAYRTIVAAEHLASMWHLVFFEKRHFLVFNRGRLASVPGAPGRSP